MFPIFNNNNLILNAIDNRRKSNINNNNNLNFDALRYNLENYHLRNPINVKCYKNLFNNRIKSINKPLIFTQDIFSDKTNNNNYFCSTCKLSFNNVKSHDFNMYNKCPSVIKQNNFIVIETMYETHNYNFKFLTDPGLDVELKIIKDERDKYFYITNYLLIKCPICLTFKLNCIIQRCGHCLCKDCLNNFLKINTIFKCWLCRQSYNNKNEKILLKL